MTFKLKVVFTRSSCLLCSMYERINKRGTSSWEHDSSVFEIFFFLPVFVIVTQHAPAKHFWMRGCSLGNSLSKDAIIYCKCSVGMEVLKQHLQFPVLVYFV